MSGTFAEELGKALRRARAARGLTLRSVAKMSSGDFKPSSLASYERAERAISMERFSDLVALYRIPPERLIAQVSRAIEGRPPRVVDVETVTTIGGVEAAILGGFVHEVLTLRGQPESDAISLREGDLEVLATASGRRLEQFLDAIEPALRTP